MVPGRVLAASHACPGNVDRCFPLDKAHNLRHRVLGFQIVIEQFWLLRNYAISHKYL